MAEVECEGDIIMADGSVEECAFRKEGKCTASLISINFDDDGDIDVSCPESRWVTTT